MLCVIFDFLQMARKFLSHTCYSMNGETPLVQELVFPAFDTYRITTLKLTSLIQIYCLSNNIIGTYRYIFFMKGTE
jgi:hypothetical protein